MTEKWDPRQTYYALTLDPIHVGTGGYRLGRVDMSIVREPGTNLPKIPGTSLSGVARAYTAMGAKPEQRYRWKGRDFNGVEKDFMCAGKGGADGESHCGKPDCPVCVTYGFSKGKTSSSFQGLAQFSDARILFFPVHSMKGPVWITCPAVLKDLKDEKTGSVNLVDEDKLSCFKFEITKNGSKEDKGLNLSGNLNLGWLLLSVGVPTISLHDKFGNISDEIRKRAILVSDNLFSHIVNDNLEVRTSVAIDPATGAAEEHALYSYEAIPRATVLWFDVVFNKPEHFRVKVPENGKLNDKEIFIPDKYKGQPWKWISDNVWSGLDLMQFLGVGGMGTRGMGRLRVLKPPEMPEGPQQPLEETQPPVESVIDT